MDFLKGLVAGIFMGAFVFYAYLSKNPEKIDLLKKHVQRINK